MSVPEGWHNALRKGKKLEKSKSNTEKKKPSVEVKEGKIIFSPDPATALIYLCVLLNDRDLMPMVLEIAEDEADAKDLLQATAVAMGSIAEQILQAREKSAEKGKEKANPEKRPSAKA
jgi:hypothetical protein